MLKCLSINHWIYAIFIDKKECPIGKCPIFVPHLHINAILLGSFSSFFRSGLEPLLGSEAAEVAANIINSIIQMPQTCRCSCLRINLCFVPQPVLLPVEEISSWLNRTIGDGMNFIGRRTPQEIFLRIYATRIQNVVEMCDHLAEVRFFINF